MKHLLGFLAGLLLVAFVVVTPTFAQGPALRGDHVCLGGQTVVQGYTPQSVVLFGCNARIVSGTQVARDVVSFGGNVVLEPRTRVGGGVVVWGGNTDIAGEVEGQVTVFGGVATLEPTAVIQGDVRVLGGNAVQKEGATVRGRFLRGEGTPFRISPFAPFTFSTSTDGGVFGLFFRIVFGIVRSVVTALALAALGALTVVFLPAQVRQVGDVAENSPLPSLGIGCLTSLVVPTLSVLLVIIILGIPAALLLLLAWVVAGLFGWIAIGRIVGLRLLEAFKVRDIVPVVGVVVGAILLALLGSVPILGGLITLIVGLLGLGAVVLSRFGTRPYPPTAPTALLPPTPSAPSEPTTL